MTFAAPLALAALALVLPIIVALHTLRREEHATASLFLWSKVASRRRGARKRRAVPWTSPLLWLHLAIATLGVLAFAGPRIGGGEPVDHLVVLLDGSRSMRSADVAPTRFDAAAGWAGDVWDATHQGALRSLVFVSDEARILVARHGSTSDLAGRLAAVDPEDTTPAWHDALAVARSLLVPGERSRIVLLSDGSSDEAIDAALQEPYDGAGLEVERYVWGGPVVNVGVAEVEVEPRGTTENRWTVRGEVRSDGLQRGDVVRVQVFFRPEDMETSLPWTGADVAVERNGSGAFELPIDLPGDGILEVRTAGQDQQPADDVARRVLRSEAATTRVAVVGPEAAAIVAALRAVGDVRIASFDELPDADVTRAFDLVVATSEVDRPVGTSVFWFGSPPASFIDAPAGSEITTAAAVPGHPLMRDVDVASIGVRSARTLTLPTGAEPLITLDGEVLAWSRTTASGRQVAFGFGPGESAWASQVSFPVFVASLVSWARSTEPSGVASCLAGTPCALPTEAFEGGWELTDASGSRVASAPPLTPAGDRFAEGVWPGGAFDAAFVPRRAGIYELRLPDAPSRWIAVDAPASDDRTASSDDGAAASRRPAEPAGAGPRLWRWIAAVATVLLIVDAVVAWRSSRASLSARSRSGRSAARWTLAALAGATLLGLAGAALVPTPQVSAAATRVVLHDASGTADAPTADRSGWTRWIGWRTVDLFVGTEPPGAGTERADPVVPNAERGFDLGRAMHAGGGPVVLDTHRLGVPDVPARYAAELVARVDAEAGTLAVRVGDTSATTDVDRDASGFERVAVPLAPRAGGAFELEATLTPLDRPAVLEVVDETGEPVDVHPVEPGTSTVRRTLQAGDAGWASYGVRLREVGGADPSSEPGETIYETRVVVNVADPLRALVVASSDEVGTLLVPALEAQRIEVDRVAGNRIPATLERLLAYEIVFLVDVPASEIHPFHQEMLQSFVRDEGGGLVIVGGSRSFGPGGYYSTVLDDVSPLSSRIEEDTPEVAMTFVLDRSGSMNAPEGDATRLDLAKLATFEAIRLLGERSQAALVAFDTEATTLLPLRSTAVLDPFRSALQTIVAGGGTSIYPALVEAYDVVAASESATRHVIVLTDGLSEEADFEEILTRIGSLGVDTSFVGVGDAASRGQLTRLAGYGGGSLHFTNDARALPGILAQEALMLSADPIEERATDPSWVEGEAPAFLGTSADVGLAPFLGYVRTTAKDEATVLLEDASSEDPLLATWRYGVGRVAAFTSEADGPWSGTWTQQDDFATFWSQLARWSATTVPAEPYRLDVAIRGSVADVVLEVAPSREIRHPPVAAWTTADGEGVLARVPLEREEAGRWTARLALPDADGAVYQVRVSSADDGILAEPATYAFVHRPEAWNERSAIDVVPLAELSRRLAEAQGGRAAAASGSEAGAARLPPVLPDVTLRASPRWWLLASLTIFMLAMGVRFGGLSVGGFRRS